MKAKKDIKYGRNSKIKEDLRSEDAKVRITLFVDGDVLLKIRDEAKERKTKYQTLINQTLREVFLGKAGGKSIIEDLESIKKQVKLLERKFKRASSD